MAICTIATFEHERRRERQRQGILAAKKAGKNKGRKTVITAEVKDLKENSSLSVVKIARLMGRSRNTIYKILKNELNYLSNRLIKGSDKSDKNE
jgi:DNA invertase Pin-like site-specific DNA recombinase